MAVLGPNSDVDPAQLRVIDHQLCVALHDGSTPTGLTGVDYMLFRVEGRAQRDDWRLPDVDAPRRRALAALQQGSFAAAEGLRAVAIAAAYESADLSDPDRRRVVDSIKAEYDQIASGARGATGEALSELEESVRTHGGTLERARALGRLTEAEAFGQ
jgi:hypothetical protein